MNMPLDPTSIRVVVVDDHPLLREGTQALLARTKGIKVVGATGEGATALRLVRKFWPDVLLLDIHLPDINGVEVARRVRTSFPQVAVLILTGYDDAGYVRALLHLGVQGYLGKTASGGEIVAAIQAVAQGCKVLAEATRAADEVGSEPLTAREWEVLRLLTVGRRNSEIATTLNVSVKTVEFHVSHILGKLGARSRTEALLKARQLDLAIAAKSA